MARTISCLLNNIILRPNRIPNKALKTYGLLITPQLADVAKVCFAIGHYLRLKKTIITIILHKKGKADYSLLRSYRPITLKNTLSKILKRVIIEYMANIAKKKYALLLQSQIRAKKNHSTLSAFTLLISIIKTAQAI